MGQQDAAVRAGGVSSRSRTTGTISTSGRGLGSGGRWWIDTICHEWVSGLYGKPLFRYKERLAEFTPIVPDFIVDDYPEIVSALGGVQIRPPVWPMTEDGEMWRVYEAFASWVGELPSEG